MKKSRITISFIFIFIAMLTIIVSCGNDTSVNGSKDKVTTLTWYTIGGEPKDINKVLKEVNQYLEEKINVNWRLHTKNFCSN